VLVMPACLPFLAVRTTSPDSQLPACCRRDGKHHCAMMAMAERDSQKASFRQQPAACPYRSGSFTLTYSFGLYPPASLSFYASIVEHPAVHQQTELRHLISATRSHQKRGPPSPFLFS